MAKLCYLLIFIIFSGVCGIQVELDEEWKQYKERFNKTYHSDCQEKIKRKNWEKNLELIFRHNLEADMGVHNFTVGLNEFSDMSFKEFAQVMTGSFRYNDTMPVTEIYSPPLDVKINASVDYRKQGMVTVPENQGTCGGCYSFCTCACLEGMYMKYQGQLIALSEQNIIDCSREFGNKGCDGGLPQYAFEYVIQNLGIDTDKSYPFEMKNGECRFNPQNAVPPACDEVVRVSRGDEKRIQIAVGVVGPVAVAMNAETVAFQHYRSGIFSDPMCSMQQVNHCVTLIGYGTEDGQEYWIVKNSWGTSWGEGGFFRLARNRNMCRIAQMAVFCK